MVLPRLSTTEFAVLGLLAERDSHGFALAKELDAGSDVGRVFTVRRSLVYRALDRLVEFGYAEAVTTEQGDAGPQRLIHRATSNGRRRLHAWLDEPVQHVRDLRIDFLLKLALLRRSGRSSARLIRSQVATLNDTLQALDGPDRDDPVELWRWHNAAAARAYLADLEEMVRERHP